MRIDFYVLIETRYKSILAGLAALVFLFGLAGMAFRPIELNSGQTDSWWEVIKNVESGWGYKACNQRYVPNCALTDQYTATREPLPVFLFAFVGWLTRDSVIAFQFIQILITLLIMFGVFWLGQEMGGLSAGLLAAAMWAFYLPAIRLESQITGDLLEGLFVVYGFLKFAYILKQCRADDWLAFGFLFGLGTLSRSAALISVGALGFGYLVYVYVQKRNSAAIPQGWFIKAAVSAGVFALVLSPWVIRNCLVFGEPIVGTTLTGYGIYRHNAIIATDAPPHFVGPEEAKQFVQAVVARRPELLTPLNEAQVNRLFLEEARTLIKTHPLKYIALSAYRFLPLWFNIGVDKSYSQDVSAWDYVIIFKQAVLLIVFILGLFNRKKTIDLISLVGFSVVVYLAAYLAIQGQLRYVIPVASGIMAIGSAGFLSILPARIRRQLP